MLGDDGAGRASFDLPDGTHPGVPRTAVRRGGRRGSTSLAPFTVDTAAPRLAVEDLGGQEAWAARVAAEPGSDVSWRFRKDGAGDLVADGAFTAGAEPRPVEVTGLEEGGYDVPSPPPTRWATRRRDLPTEVDATPLSAGTWSPAPARCWCW